MSCKPAKKMIVVGPIPQRLIRIKAGFDQTSLLNQGGPGMPTRARRSLISPYSGCKIQAQTTDAATTGTIEGALQKLNGRAIDATVVDLHLESGASADGGHLLDICKSWHPGVVRILATADPLGATIAREGGHLFYDKDDHIAELVLMIRIWVPRA